LTTVKACVEVEHFDDDFLVESSPSTPKFTSNLAFTNSKPKKDGKNAEKIVRKKAGRPIGTSGYSTSDLVGLSLFLKNSSTSSSHSTLPLFDDKNDFEEQY
jgi:hypothetical protein